MGVPALQGQQGVLERLLRSSAPSDPTRRLNHLYRDARAAWLAQPFADGELHALVMVRLRQRAEVSADDDAQIRAAYELKAVAA